MTTLDVLVMVAYFAAVTAVGVRFARQSDDAGYFLGGHRMPWWAVMLSIVATETSALTVISLPGLGARSNLSMLQLAVGYLVGRIAISLWLLPGYFRGEQQTAYARLEARFGAATRRIASGIFMAIRALGDGVRVFATAIPLVLVTGWDVPVAILVVVGASVLYTWLGGIKAVIWVDVAQLVLYTAAGIIVIAVAAEACGGFGEAWERAAAAGRLAIWDLSFDLGAPYTLWSGVIGGALLTAASHGTDHLIVQRVLATANLGEARRAMVGSGLVVLVQFALFLGAGAAMYAAGVDDGAGSGDALFPRFVVTHLPSGLSGLVVAGILAAAMSTVSSSVSALASATTHDFYAPLRNVRDHRHLVRFGRAATLGWAVILVGAGLSFSRGAQPVVELALSIASITYGGLLGLYVLAGVSARVGQTHAVVGLVCGVVVTGGVVLLEPWPLGWPWLVPLGTAVTVGVAASLSRIPSKPSPHAPAVAAAESTHGRASP